jgi:hypothetical protein
VDIPEEGKGKGKERSEVGEGDDTVTIKDTFDEEDEEMLQERFQLLVQVHPSWTAQCASHQ